MNGASKSHESHWRDAIRRVALLDASSEKAFERIARLASRLLRMPYAYVAFVDDDYEKVAAAHQLVFKGVERSSSLSDAAIVSDDVLVGTDLGEHPRFATNPLVAREPKIQFVAAAPVRSPDGQRIGALVVADRTHHTLGDQDLSVLSDLAGIVTDEIERALTPRGDRASDSQLARSSSDCELILELTATGTVCSANSAAGNLLGYQQANLVGTDILTKIDAESVPRIRDAFLHTLSGANATVPVEFRVRHQDGSWRSLEGTVSSVRTVDGPARFALQVHELTAKRQPSAEVHQINQELERRVAQRTAELEAANQELEAFSYSVSHDLRAPLRLIDSFSRVLLHDYAPPLDEEPRRYLQIIQDNAQQMGVLLDALLDFSRLNLRPLRKQPVQISQLVREVLAELLAHNAGHHVVVTIAELPACLADPILIRQVVVNLLSNAIKFSRRRQTANIEVGYQPNSELPGWIDYFVKDNGVGFDMNYAERLFGVFQRLHSAEEFEGAGVGLAIVERIVRRHGGRVWAKASIDGGATFYFSLESAGPAR